MILYEDRRDGGRALAERLKSLRGAECVVLGLPRGGVPVAFEVACALAAPLDVFLVRKLGSPRDPEFAIGAIASGGVRVLHEDDIADLGIGAPEIARIEAREKAELARREALYRRGPSHPLTGRIAVLVDDGLATGATMTAAVRAVRLAGAKRVVAAAPVSSSDAAASLAREADEFVCAAKPLFFLSVGAFYRSFPQTSDAEVRELLAAAERRDLQEPAEGGNEPVVAIDFQGMVDYAKKSK